MRSPRAEALPGRRVDGRPFGSTTPRCYILRIIQSDLSVQTRENGAKRESRPLRQMEFSGISPRLATKSAT